MTPARKPPKPRPAGVVQIQIARRQLKMSDDDYYAMLQGVAGVKSATDLTNAGCDKVLKHLRACGFKPTPPRMPTPGRPRNMDHPTRGPMLHKVEALLLSAGRSWEYANATAKHMFGVDDVSFCHEGQLHRLVSALQIDKGRRAKRGEA
jgi:phage gp16-like protein